MKLATIEQSSQLVIKLFKLYYPPICNMVIPSTFSFDVNSWKLITGVVLLEPDSGTNPIDISGDSCGCKWSCNWTWAYVGNKYVLQYNYYNWYALNGSGWPPSYSFRWFFNFVCLATAVMYNPCKNVCGLHNWSIFLNKDG